MGDAPRHCGIVRTDFVHHLDGLVDIISAEPPDDRDWVVVWRSADNHRWERVADLDVEAPPPPRHSRPTE